MVSQEAPEDLLAAFPALAHFDRATQKELLASSQRLQLNAGSSVFEPGQLCERYVFVRLGSVRVHLLNEDGHEIVLYRLSRGETCILTTAALLGAMPYMAYAVAETETVATGLSTRTFQELITRSADFRRFVFGAHARRIIDLMQVVAEVAFTRIQVRLARCLLQRANASGRVPLTHDAIAVEIGTAREVVSRNLKLLERDGCVRLGQGTLIIVDTQKLAAFAEG